MSNTIKIHDRVKETSTTTGTGDFGLQGAVRSFKSFTNAFGDLDVVFYAIVDRDNFEIGSGIFHAADAESSYPRIERFPFSSSNNNQKIDFPAGIKEVFATYPATNAVYQSSGVAGYDTPENKGVAFWASQNMLNYDANITWDKDLKSLAIQQPTPLYGIDLGGDGTGESHIRVNGVITGTSGIFFPANNGGDSSYTGGTQYKHFVPNQNDEGLSFETNSELLVEFSGVSNEYLLLKKQKAGYIFAGPTGVCGAPCPEDYPKFRELVLDDIPDLSSAYTTLAKLSTTSGVLEDSVSTKVAASGAVLDAKYTAVSGDIISYTQGQNANLVSHFIAESGRVDQFFDTTSGRLDTLLPSGKAFTSVTVPSIPANSTGVCNFTFTGLSTSNNYSVVVSPESRLVDALLTYSYVNANDSVESVFYNYTGGTAASQTANFNVTVHRIE